MPQHFLLHYIHWGFFQAVNVALNSKARYDKSNVVKLSEKILFPSQWGLKMCDRKHDKNFVMIPNKHLKARNYKIKDKHEIKQNLECM